MNSGLLFAKARVYLDTSFVSACVTTREDAGSIYRSEVSREWMMTQRYRHDLFVSAEVINELADPNYPKSSDALGIVKGIALIEVDEEVRGLAKILVRELVMPVPVGGDAVHVASCIIYEIEYLLSWNVRHLVNPNKLVNMIPDSIPCSRIKEGICDIYCDKLRHEGRFVRINLNNACIPATEDYFCPKNIVRRSCSRSSLGGRRPEKRKSSSLRLRSTLGSLANFGC